MYHLDKCRTNRQRVSQEIMIDTALDQSDAMFSAFPSPRPWVWLRRGFVLDPAGGRWSHSASGEAPFHFYDKDAR